MEEHTLPPWTKKKRLKTMMVMTGFILGSALLLGVGLYQTGVNLGWIRRPFSKQELVRNLLNDAGFIRAVNKSVTTRQCKNDHLGFGYNFQAPFRVLTTTGPNSCTKLVALHETGADVLVSVEKVSGSRESVVANEVKNFDYVETKTMDGTNLPTSLITGERDGVATEIFVIGLSREAAFKLTYAPVSSSLTPKVTGIVESFYSIPQ